MDMIMVWLGPVIQAFFEKFFENVFGGWFDGPVEEVVACVSRASPVIANSGLSDIYAILINSAPAFV